MKMDMVADIKVDKVDNIKVDKVDNIKVAWWPTWMCTWCST